MQNIGVGLCGKRQYSRVKKVIYSLFMKYFVRNEQRIKI